MENEVQPTTEYRQEVRWDLIALVASDSKESSNDIQKALEIGYEPFAVSPHVIMPDNKLVVGQPNQPKMANMLWLKRGQIVNIPVAQAVEEANESHAE